MAKFHKVGTVQQKKDKSGTTVKLGVFNKNPQYATTVKLVVEDSNGNVLAESTDGYLIVQDPRSRPGITEEQAARIPEFILKELVLVVND